MSPLNSKLDNNRPAFGRFYRYGTRQALPGNIDAACLSLATSQPGTVKPAGTHHFA